MIQPSKIECSQSVSAEFRKYRPSWRCIHDPVYWPHQVAESRETRTQNNQARTTSLCDGRSIALNNGDLSGTATRGLSGLLCYGEFSYFESATLILSTSVRWSVISENVTWRDMDK